VIDRCHDGVRLLSSSDREARSLLIGECDAGLSAAIAVSSAELQDDPPGVGGEFGYAGDPSGAGAVPVFGSSAEMPAIVADRMGVDLRNQREQRSSGARAR
jgi:hypothetical protein